MCGIYVSKLRKMAEIRIQKLKAPLILKINDRYFVIVSRY